MSEHILEEKNNDSLEKYNKSKSEFLSKLRGQEKVLYHEFLCGRDY